MSFQTVAWISFAAFSALVQVLLLAALLRGHWRRFPLIFTFTITTLLITVAETAVYSEILQWSHFGKLLYWIDEMITQLLVFTVMFSLLYRASAGQPGRAARLRWTILIGAGVAALSLLLPYGEKQWWTNATRNLSFASAILNLFLWTRLLALRNRDPRLMMISAAFGIQTTGKAMGHSLRVLGLSPIGNPLVPITYVLSLLVLWKAFRHMKESEETPEAVHQA